MNRLMVGALLLGVLWPMTVPAQATRTVSARELRDQMIAVRELIKDANSCQSRADYVGTADRLERARAILERYPLETVLQSEDGTNWLWSCYTRLGRIHEAGRLYDQVSPDIQERWLDDWTGLKARYGSITLASPEVVRTDPTLAIARLEVRSTAGMAEFPFDLVRARAAQEIRQAFQRRDLITDPIIVPAGSNRLVFELARESGLNYEKPLLTVDFEVPPGENAEVTIDPTHRAWPKALLGVCAGILIAPFLMAN